jgi:hypothetical protein
MGWSCPSTAACRPSEIAPDRRKWLIRETSLWWNDFRAERSAASKSFTTGRLREGRHTAERIFERR